MVRVSPLVFTAGPLLDFLVMIVVLGRECEQPAPAVYNSDSCDVESLAEISSS